MMKYQEIKDGTWIEPLMKGWRMACCDCGLVHRTEFRVVRSGRGKGVVFRVWRDERATGAMRRKKKG